MARDGSLVYFFWLSNHISFFIGLAILFKSSFWLTAELSIAFVGELGWIVDFLSKLIFGVYLFGSTEYMFSPTYPTTLYWASMNHLIILPFGLAALFLLKKADKLLGKVLCCMAFFTSNLFCLWRTI
ncbi:MAG: hypothetical protein QW331_02180 [Candidatus Woesearchaeota archaeon]